MSLRLVCLLPIIVLMVLFAAPAQAVTLPNICGGGKWVSCGNNAYYCTALKGHSCKAPTFVVTRTMENWSQKQKTGTVVPKGVTMKSAPAKYTYKYVTKKICQKNSKGIRYCRYKKVRVPITRG